MGLQNSSNTEPTESNRPSAMVNSIWDCILPAHFESKKADEAKAIKDFKSAVEDRKKKLLEMLALLKMDEANEILTIGVIQKSK